MPQNITTHVHTLVAAAEREIETLSAEAPVALHSRDDVVVVDIRELDREGARAARLPLSARGAGRKAEDVTTRG